jgi:hypothetical protein
MTVEGIGNKTILWIFVILVCSLGSAQYAIYETKQRVLNLCEEQILVEEAYLNAQKTCESQVEHYKGYREGYERLEISLNEWIKDCKRYKNLRR